jgi:hypothetical protein
VRGVRVAAAHPGGPGRTDRTGIAIAILGCTPLVKIPVEMPPLDRARRGRASIHGAGTRLASR